MTGSAVLIDSSAWISFLLDQPAASKIEKSIENSSRLIVPSIVLYEVYRHLIKKVSSQEALMATTQLQKGVVVSLDEDLSLFAAEISLEHKLGMADAIVYATALHHKAQLVTLDNDFRGLDGCVVIS